MTETGFSHGGFDALPPAEVARKAETVGAVKAGMPFLGTFVLGVLAGAFIALGAIFSTTVAAGGSEGLLVKHDHGFLASLTDPPDVSGLSWGSLVTDKLIPVTLGNIVGGAILVGAVYWLVYLRRRPAET